MIRKLLPALLFLLPTLLCTGGPETPDEACNYYENLIRKTAEAQGMDMELIYRIDEDDRYGPPMCDIGADYLLTEHGFTLSLAIYKDGSAQKYWDEVSEEAKANIEQDIAEYKRRGYSVDWTVDAGEKSYSERARVTKEGSSELLQLDHECRRIRFGEICWYTEGHPKHRESPDSEFTSKVEEEPYYPPEIWLELYDRIVAESGV